MQNNNYIDEDNELLKSFLNRTFFASWKSEDLNYLRNFKQLELEINSSCDLKCDYCYYTNHGKQLYPANISKKKDILKHTDLIINWLDENKMFPIIEIFSGEPFIQNITYDILYKLIDFYYKNNVNSTIVIPSNFNFVLDDTKLDKFRKIISYANSKDVTILCSVSIDGKYCDNDNRPFRTGYIRDDNFYDKVFKIAKEYNYGFHPMVYYNNIEKWIDNFLWFQEMFKKYDIPWDNLYLLEVRNDGWTKESVSEFYKFYKFVCDWTINKISRDIKFKDNKEKIEYLFSTRCFNLFSTLGKCGRGMGCSIQSALYVRLGDLAIHPCHRLMYPWFKSAEFVVDNNKIVDIKAHNWQLYMNIISCNGANFPWCQDCLIKHVCGYGCLGSQFEAMGDPFVPIPSVCYLEHAKFKAIVDSLIENDYLNYFLNICGDEQKDTILVYLKYFHNSSTRKNYIEYFKKNREDHTVPVTKPIIAS